MAHESEPTDNQPPKANIPSPSHLLQTPKPTSNNLTSTTLQRTQSLFSSLTATLLPPQSRTYLHTLTPPTRHTIRTTLVATLRAHPRRTSLVFLGLVAELQQPGFIPRPTELSKLLASAPCVTLLICVALVLEEWKGKETWESVREGFLKRYWGDEGEGGGDESTVVIEAGVDGETCEEQKQTPPSADDDESTQSTTPRHKSTHAENEARDSASPTSLSPPPSPPQSQPHPQPAHPPAAAAQPLPAHSPQPPTLLAPDLVLSPLTPGKMHTSGLLGESPMPAAARFSSKHFSGMGFARRNRVLREMGVWSGYEGKAVSELVGVGEERVDEEGDGE